MGTLTTAITRGGGEVSVRHLRDSLESTVEGFVGRLGDLDVLWRRDDWPDSLQEDFSDIYVFGIIRLLSFCFFSRFFFFFLSSLMLFNALLLYFSSFTFSSCLYQIT